MRGRHAFAGFSSETWMLGTRLLSRRRPKITGSTKRRSTGGLAREPRVPRPEASSYGSRSGARNCTKWWARPLRPKAGLVREVRLNRHCTHLRSWSLRVERDRDSLVRLNANCDDIRINNRRRARKQCLGRRAQRLRRCPWPRQQKSKVFKHTEIIDSNTSIIDSCTNHLRIQEANGAALIHNIPDVATLTRDQRLAVHYALCTIATLYQHTADLYRPSHGHESTTHPRRQSFSRIGALDICDRWISG